MDGEADPGYSLVVVPGGDQNGGGGEQPQPCVWCGTPFRPRRTGGTTQKFCRSACRNAFWSAARQWVWRAVSVGLISPAAIRHLSMHAEPDAPTGEF